MAVSILDGPGSAGIDPSATPLGVVAPRSLDSRAATYAACPRGTGGAPMVNRGPSEAMSSTPHSRLGLRYVRPCFWRSIECPSGVRDGSHGWRGFSAWRRGFSPFRSGHDRAVRGAPPPPGAGPLRFREPGAGPPDRQPHEHLDELRVQYPATRRATRAIRRRRSVRAGKGDPGEQVEPRASVRSLEGHPLAVLPVPRRLRRPRLRLSGEQQLLPLRLVRLPSLLARERGRRLPERQGGPVATRG